MQSEVEKLVERLRNYRPPTVDGYGYPPGQEPREHHTICDEAASLIESLYRERETALNMRDQLAKALRQTCGLVVEFGNLNGFRNLSDEELGSAVMGVAREGARVLNLYDAALAEQPQ
jgi:hypothetical protein